MTVEKPQKKRSALFTLVKKNLFFTTPPAMWLFVLMSALILIPSYPMIVAPGYIFLAIFNVFNVARANKDLEFTVNLPVRRKDVVTGSAFLVVAFEAATLVSCGAFAAIADFVISPSGNVVGLDPNLTLFGVAAAGYGAFNLIFLPGFYRTGYKSGLPTLFGVLGYLALYGIAETLVQSIPSLTAALDGLNAEYLWARAIALAVGLLLMGALTAIGVKLGQKKFDKISL